jgi:hypothetical protein
MAIGLPPATASRRLVRPPLIIIIIIMLQGPLQTQ